MKTLIVYDSHHGFTEKCVGMLVGELPPGADLWPLRNSPGVPVWSAYTTVVFGGPVYFGRWSPRLMAFLARHHAALNRESLTLATFVVSLSPRAAALRYLSRGLPPNLKGKLGHVSCFGGGITWKELTWWEKLVMKHGHRIETDASNLDLGEIQSLAAWLSARAKSAKDAPT